MSKYNKLLAVLIIFALLFISLAGCNNQNDKKESVEQNNNADNQSGENDGDTQDAGKSDREPPVNLPEKDFDGYEFVILATDSEHPWHTYATDEENAEIMNDAVYIRNRRIEDRYNISIKQVSVGDPSGTASRSLRAMDNSYDLLMISLDTAANFAIQGFLQDIHQIPYLSEAMIKPWWDQGLREELTINGKLFFNTGDITTFANLRTACMYFNKGMFQQFNLEYPYESVKSGKWTIDALLELTKGVNRDVNGDGVMDQEDQWGFMSEWRNGTLMYYACGESITRKVGDNFEITFANTRSIEVIDKILTICTDGISMFHANTIKGASNVWYEASNLFQQDRFLVRSSLFEPIPRDLRNMPTDFGVIPYVKFDENQDKYYSLTGNEGTVAAIPVYAVDGDLERTGIMVESLAYDSIDTLTVAFYDKSLTSKVMRDDESSEMLDIIFSSKVFSLGHIFNIGGYGSMLDSMVQSKNTNFMSGYEKAYDRAVRDLEKIMNQYHEVTG